MTHVANTSVSVCARLYMLEDFKSKFIMCLISFLTLVIRGRLDVTVSAQVGLKQSKLFVFSGKAKLS